LRIEKESGLGVTQKQIEKTPCVFKVKKLISNPSKGIPPETKAKVQIMSHGIVGKKAFVFGLAGQGTDWHKLTIEKPALTRELFPNLQPSDMATEIPDGKGGFVWAREVEKRLIDDAGNRYGIPFNPDSTSIFTPRDAWTYVETVLAGTGYKVERMGMLWDGNFWFISVLLEELKGVARKGEGFQLNFSGSLDGKSKVQCELSHVRAVCWNTISASRASGKVLFAEKRTKNFSARLEARKEEIERAVGMAAVFNATLESLEAKPASALEAKRGYAGFLSMQSPRGVEIFAPTMTAKGKARESRARNTVDELVGLFQRGDGNKGQTRFDVLNGATQLWTRGSVDSDKDKQTALESGSFGGWADRKAEFFNLVSDDKAWGEAVKVGTEALAMN
jgi:hypothetical protein